MLTDKKAKKSISLDSRFVNLKNAGKSTTLMPPRNSNKNLVLHIYTEKTMLGNIWLLQLCIYLANLINVLLVKHLWEAGKVYSNNSSHSMNKVSIQFVKLYRRGVPNSPMGAPQGARFPQRILLGSSNIASVFCAGVPATGEAKSLCHRQDFLRFIVYFKRKVYHITCI